MTTGGARNGRRRAGIRTIAATIQAADDASPLTKEQFDWHQSLIRQTGW